jgi:hypothetical protein
MRRHSTASSPVGCNRCILLSRIGCLCLYAAPSIRVRTHIEWQTRPSYRHSWLPKSDRRGKKKRGQSPELRRQRHRAEVRGYSMEGKGSAYIKDTLKPFASGGGSARQRIGRKIDVRGERN